MYSLPRIVVGLSVVGFAAALQEHASTAKSCSWSPLLIREHQLTCTAPPLLPLLEAKPRPATLFNVGTPELMKEYGERYEPPKAYDLPASWEEPKQCFTEFCLYSNPDVDEGMSLLTTNRYAYLVATSPVPKSAGIESTAYRAAEVPGKGVGLIANRLIRKGEIIMQRPAALLIQSTPHLDLDPELREEVYQSAIDQLPAATKARFMSQMGDTVYDRTEKNAFRIYLDGDRKHSTHLGLFPEVSKINHDCRPNLHYRIANLTHTTVAVRDIPAGEELSVSYIYGKSSRSDRQSQLHEWGFNCTCSQCTLPARESGASDVRIRQIQALEEEIEALMSSSSSSVDTSNKGIRPEMGGKLVELFLAERLDAYLAPSYTRAALIYSMFGHEARAREYAGEAVGALEREVGLQARDIESMRRLAENPKAHWSWAVKVTSRGPGGGKNKTQGVAK
ncbi:SET domain-containing protein 5 [Chaetomidium leptoderma]|uniref:SET domain-containing protein 5 n=1 Tax=Chaetomidium leptoderma TaxID=669021 RepID=A0AAN6VQY1_9PEZI|nr:SET domain-containing protein 5 [Chaetomidium leptoderma]